MASLCAPCLGRRRPFFFFQCGALAPRQAWRVERRHPPRAATFFNRLPMSAEGAIPVDDIRLTANGRCDGNAKCARDSAGFSAALRFAKPPRRWPRVSPWRCRRESRCRCRPRGVAEYLRTGRRRRASLPAVQPWDWRAG